MGRACASWSAYGGARGSYAASASVDGGWWQIAEAADSGLDSIATPIYDRQDRLPEQKPGRVKNTTLFEPPKTLAQLSVCLDSLGDEPALPPVAAEFIQAVGLWLIQSSA